MKHSDNDCICQDCRRNGYPPTGVSPEFLAALRERDRLRVEVVE